MSKITLNNVGSIPDNPTSASTTINNNSAVIQTAFDNTLSRDGTSPNQMGSNFDMNGFRILNLPAPTHPTDPVRLEDLTTSGSGGGGSGTPSLPFNSVQYNSVGAFGGNSGLTYTAGGALTIAPTTLTNNSGFNITQTTPNSGTVAGPNFLNLITVNDQAQTVTGSTIDSFGQITNQTTGLRINHAVTGGTANHFGISVASLVTGTNAGVSPIVGGVYSNTGGPITGDWWGLIGYVNAGPSCNLNQSAIAIEAEVLIATGGTVKDRVGLSINSQGPTNATGVDAAIVVNTMSNPVTNYTGTPAQFKDGMFFSNSFYGSSQFPIGTSGNIFRGDTGTVTNFAKFSTLTVTGNIFDFGSPFAVSGAGAITAAGKLTVNLGTATPLSGVAYFGAADAASSQFQVASFGVGVNSAVSLRAARGTGASPQPSQANDVIGFYNAFGQATTIAGDAAGVGLAMISSELHTSSAQGMYAQMLVTNTGTTTRVAGVTFQASGGLSIGGQTIAAPANDPGAGGIAATGSIKSLGATSGIGYATGAGGAVTQITSRTTAVTLNTVSGAITLLSQVNVAVSGATAQSFTVNNTAVAATDTVIVNQKSGTDKYLTFVTNVAAGSFQITNYTTGGTTNEAPVFTFNVIKGVTS